jgi:hypothetical protein
LFADYFKADKSEQAEQPRPEPEKFIADPAPPVSEKEGNENERKTNDHEDGKHHHGIEGVDGMEQTHD